MIRTRIRSTRTKARRGRLKGRALSALRLACYERDGHCCVVCGRALRWERGYEDSLNMAHIGAKRRHGDSLANVRSLCPRDHRDEHNAGGKPCPKKETA